MNLKKKTEGKKEAARVASKVNYKKKPEGKKEAARVASKVSYAKNSKIKIGHSKAYYARNKQSISAKRRDRYSLCETKQGKIEMYLQDVQANLLDQSRVCTLKENKILVNVAILLQLSVTFTILLTSL